MALIDQLGGLLQSYLGAAADQAPPTAQDDFAQLARNAPADALAQGIAGAFRSDQTPPFGQLVGQLFGQSDPHQQAGLLTTLLQAVGPAVAAQVLSGAGLSGLTGLLGQRQVTPSQASQFTPEAVGQLAAQAENRSPSIVDMVSGFYAQHPDLVRALGAGVATAALSALARQHNQGGGQAGSGYQYGGQEVLSASEDPYGDPADQQVLPASADPYGDPADRA